MPTPVPLLTTTTSFSASLPRYVSIISLCSPTNPALSDRPHTSPLSPPYLSPQATENEIRETFLRLACEFHPDRATSSAGYDTDHNTAIFTMLSQAYNVLNDPISRSLYDIAQGYKPDTPDVRRQINRMKREQAETQTQTFENIVSAIREEEEQVDGLIIVEALYGDVSVDNDSSESSGTAAAGRCMDVTAALQCQVQSSILFLHGGGSKSWLEGFYDPNDHALENMLYIRYRFQGAMHECLFGDMDEVCVPSESHIIPEQVDDETDDEGAAPRTPRRHGRKHGSTLRASVRVKPRSLVQSELANLKAARRLAAGSGLWYAQKRNWVTLPSVDTALARVGLEGPVKRFMGTAAEAWAKWRGTDKKTAVAQAE